MRSKELFEYLRQSGMHVGEPGELEAEEGTLASESAEPAGESSRTESATTESTTTGSSTSTESQRPLRPEQQIAAAFVEARTKGMVDPRREEAEADEATASSKPASSTSESRKSRPSKSSRREPVDADTSRSKAPRAKARREKETAKSRRERANEPVAALAADEAPRGRRVFGDQVLAVSYNNAALMLLFAASLMILTYFLGFTQGIGNLDARERELRADGYRTPYVPVVQPEAAPSTVTPGDSAAPAASVLEGMRVVHAVQCFTAERKQWIDMHTNHLRKEGYEPWFRQDARGRFVLFVGQYEERTNELEDLLGQLRIEKVVFPDSRETVMPYADAIIVQVQVGRQPEQQ